MVMYHGAPPYIIGPEYIGNVPLGGFWVIFMGWGALKADTGEVGGIPKIVSLDTLYTL